MVFKWNDDMLVSIPCDRDEQFEHHLYALKQRVQPTIQIDGYKTPTAEQHCERKAHLCRLIDDVCKINLGCHVLSMIPSNSTILSFEPVQMSGWSIALKDYMMINIFPDTLQKRKEVQVNALVHEGFHLAHELMETVILDDMKNKGKTVDLNLYDRFSLRFLDEAACHLNGQMAQAYFEPIKSKTVIDLRTFFQNPDYWQTYYTDMVDALKLSDNPMPLLEGKHTQAYYTLQIAYFSLHPELKDAHIMRHIHKGWKLFADTLKNEWHQFNSVKTVSQSIYDSFSDKIPHLIKQAVNIRS